jgi:hypothetical protein
VWSSHVHPFTRWTLLAGWPFPPRLDLPAWLSAVNLAVSLANEFTHIKLGGLMHLLTMANTNGRACLYPPRRDDPRPNGGYCKASTGRRAQTHQHPDRLARCPRPASAERDAGGEDVHRRRRPPARRLAISAVRPARPAVLPQQVAGSAPESRRSGKFRPSVCSGRGRRLGARHAARPTSYRAGRPEAVEPGRIRSSVTPPGRGEQRAETVESASATGVTAGADGC